MGSEQTPSSEKAEKMEDGLRRNSTSADSPGAQSPAPMASDSGSDEQPDWPGGGIPVVLLWLPYTALTALLLGLMIASFVRFHKKRLRKFQARKEQLWRQLDVQEFLLQQRRREVPPNGDLLPPITTTLPRLLPTTPDDDDDDDERSSRIRCKDRSCHRKNSLDAFDGHFEPILHNKPQDPSSHPYFRPTSRDFADSQNRIGGESSLSSVKTDRNSSILSGNHHHHHNHRRRRRLPMPPTDRCGDRLLSSQLKGRTERSDISRKRSSVVFITNINGSMVNLRCGEPDSLDPFQGRRCFWSTKNREVCQPMRQLIEPSCLGHRVQRPEIWTTFFSYEQESHDYD